MRAEHTLIWGGGGHGKVVADLVRSRGWNVAGFVDRNPEKLGTVVEPGGARVVIGEADLCRSLRSSASLPEDATVIAFGIGDNAARLRCARLLMEFRDASLMAVLVHPSAFVSTSATLLEGTVVLAGAVINADAFVGRAVIVNSGAIVEHDCEIGDGTHIAPGATLTGGVRVGEACLIGARAVVLPGVVVQDGATVGAGAVVNRDVPARACVAGVPARVLVNARHV